MFEVTSTIDVSRVLDALKRAERAAVKAMAEGVYDDSQEIVPVDTGRLKASGGSTVRTKSGRVEGVAFYGGPDAPHAASVHDGRVRLKSGQSQFLRAPLMNHRRRLAEAAAAYRKALKSVAR